MSLTERVLARDRLSLAQLLTKLEREAPEGYEVLADLYPHTGKAHIIGITGASGTGKSTLVNRIALAWRQRVGPEGRAPTLAVVAVDPSSPYSGGALLGDRIRMRDLSGDPGVFIRSMATRGALGGLAPTTYAFAAALDAAGFDVVLIETVGAGQSEVEVAGLAHTTLVVEAPGLGDGVQALKAGILEIADILVLNKADLPGADDALRTLRLALEMTAPARRRVRSVRQIEPGNETEGWTPVIVSTVAATGQGVDELIDAIEAHRRYLESADGVVQKDRERARAQMEDLLRQRLLSRFLRAQPDGRFEAALERVLAREVPPWRAVDDLMQERGRG